jgi:hypothetical protein
VLNGTSNKAFRPKGFDDLPIPHTSTKESRGFIVGDLYVSEFGHRDLNTILQSAQSLGRTMTSVDSKKWDAV